VVFVKHKEYPNSCAYLDAKRIELRLAFKGGGYTYNMHRIALVTLAVNLIPIPLAVCIDGPVDWNLIGRWHRLKRVAKYL